MMHVDDAPESRALVALSLIPGLGPRKILNLVRYFGSAKHVMSAAPDQLRRVKGIGKALADSIVAFNEYDAVEAQFGAANRLQAKFITRIHSDYPTLLKNIFDPPPFLWGIGKTDLLWNQTIAVVGTRKPSDYGKRITRRIVRDLSRAGFVTVSGLAYGIDAIAHHETVQHNGTTVAILGSGLDKIYPAAHVPLARKIVERGCLISSFPFGTRPDPSNFPQRNRLISGVSLGTVVTEAFSKGGALITARYALEQNRDVFAVPGSVDAETSSGTNALIRDSAAKLVTSSTDVVAEIEMDLFKHAVATKEILIPNRKLSVDEQMIVACLDLTPTHVDTICRQIALKPENVMAGLLRLELYGVIRRSDGNHFVKL